MKNFREAYDKYRNSVNEYLLDFLPRIDEKSSSLNEAMKYSLEAGGKRLRPVLLLAACQFAGGDCKEAMPYACAIEYIHTYSLIHDDLPSMDNDDLRRGKPTNHKVFGDAIATLAGDGLLNTAFETMIKDLYLHFDDTDKMKRRINAMYTVAKHAGVKGMVAGQVSDMEAENQDSSLEMIEYIHINKTGALIVAAVRAGLYLGGADDEMMSNMTTYAEYLGLAYQIADDILDEIGNSSHLGKNTGTDKARKKITYVSKEGLEASLRKLNEYTENAVAAIEGYYDNAEFFRDLVLTLAKRKR
ncbi:MAG: polyprenyl synthetase family protein [Clostridiales bacterium]|nr:polyprenyl synthetase family protein [Clostridiales bacterium]